MCAIQWSQKMTTWPMQSPSNHPVSMSISSEADEWRYMRWWLAIHCLCVPETKRYTADSRLAKRAVGKIPPAPINQPNKQY